MNKNFEYHITIINVCGMIEKLVCYTRIELDKTVNEINKERYFSIQKIEKFKYIF